MAQEEFIIKDYEYYLKKMEKLVNSNQMIEKEVSSFIKKRDEIFEKALRENAVPPVKGEITKGKLKWRGIRIAQKSNGFKITYSIQQRGVNIGPEVSLETFVI